MQLLHVRNLKRSANITRNYNTKYRRNYRHYHHQNNKNRNYFKWFINSTSSIVLSASIFRYMEPKTTTTFSEKFENENDILDIIYTGYHKWTSQGHYSYQFMHKATKTFKPHFSYAVYRKKYTMEEALEIERNNLDLETYENITSNDFPYHYNRVKKRRKTEFKNLRDEKWANASDDEKRIMYQEIQREKKRERIINDLRKKRRGRNPKAKESRSGYYTEISEKELKKELAKEAEAYLENRDYSRQRDILLELMESEEAMNNLYIFHIKFLQHWSILDFLHILFEAWNNFGLFNYSTHTQQTLSCIKLVNDLEDNQIGGIHEGDELLIIVNEPNHEMSIYFKNNFIPVGYDGSNKHITLKNKQKQQLNYAKWSQHCEKQPFVKLCQIKTDLLSECVKICFLQNSITCKITTPKECEIVDVESDFDRIKKKYGLE